MITERSIEKVHVPEYSLGECQECGAFAELGDGLCVQCYDKELGKK